MAESDETSIWRKKPGELTFLFWNINAKNILPSITRLVEQYNVDVLILAECQITSVDMLLALNPVGQAAAFYQVQILCERIALYTRFPSDFVLPQVDEDKYTICSLRLPGEEELLLVAAHLLSWREALESTLYDEAQLFASEIRRVEDQQGHKRTLVIGDLNLNPFSAGVVSATGLHATMSRSIALQRTRQAQKKDYPFFYNPMWSQMAERFDAQTGAYSPPGTYYYRSSDHVCYFWNTFDQVLLRPDLLDRCNDAHLRVITSTGDANLLTSRAGIPGGEHGSDHLPIMFKLGPAIKPAA